ncbi:MAG: AAA family ATPase [Caldilineaceae bacterium]|nr:AAA family ATPase [Caldilineaceae bacterium]
MTLTELSINNYRIFNNFYINSLSRVNLLVGTNNSGKSSFLEAVHLLTSDDIASSLIVILNERGELAANHIDDRYMPRRYTGYQISQIFHGRTIGFGLSAHIDSQDRALDISIRKSTRNQQEIITNQSAPSSEVETNLGNGSEEEVVKLLVFNQKRQTEIDTKSLKLDDNDNLSIDPRRYLSRATLSSSKSRMVTTNYLDYSELADLWDSITLTPKEDKVVEALQILEPKVDRISFTSRQTSNSGILVRLKGEKEPFPLGSMGDGMRRIIAISASLVSVEDGTLLVDEIDTGLYYQALTDMWRLVLETAAKQDAQVFATTHSWDCVRAFQAALNESSNPNMGCLIRLDKYEDKIYPVLYSAKDLDTAIEQNIEVR